MGKLTEEEIMDLKLALEVFRAIDVNEIFNAYVIESVAFGDLKAGDKVPFDRFVEVLRLHAMRPHSVRESIVGVAITEDERVAEKEPDFFFFECFISKINRVFHSAPQNKKKDEDENGLLPFKKEEVRAYIMRLFPLFKEILQTEVEQDFFAPAWPFSERAAETKCYQKISRFLVAVMTRGVRQGGRVDRYLKDVPYLPYYVKRLLKEKNGRLLLANSDTESLDFRLACLSAMHFMSSEHTRLFESKARKWAGGTGLDAPF